MATVDTKVVSMKFDNKGFSEGVSGTVSMLDRLKNSLNFSGSKKGLDELKASGNSFNMDGMSASISGISAGFAAMATVGITALANLTNKAVDAGLAMVKSLSMDQVTAGFQEYETKMGAIQTILANTSKHGTTLDDVTSSLDELNKYADKTIYNFGDMTKNIGLFTNAGIKVENATAMIKGFSNSAAASGTNSQAAAGAAYQLSQALSTGTVRLMDWKSLSTAGMGNQNMKTGIISVAEAMGAFEGTATNAVDAASNFEASLEQKWLSAGVMEEYLKIMAGEVTPAQMKSLGLTDQEIVSLTEQARVAEEAATKVRTFTQLVGTLKEGIGSSWAQSFDLVLGDFDEATTFFSGVSKYLGDIVEESAASRNAVLGGWKELGGRDTLIQGLMYAIDSLKTAIMPIKEAFREVFPKKTAEDLVALTTRFRDFMQSLKMGEGTAASIKNVMLGVFSTFKIGVEVISGIASVIYDLFRAILPVGGGFLSVAGGIGSAINAFRIMMVEGNGIEAIFEKISSVLLGFAGPVASVLSLIPPLFQVATEYAKLFAQEIVAFAEKVPAAFDEAKRRLELFLEPLDGVRKKLQGIFGGGDDKDAEKVDGGVKKLKASLEAMNPALEGTKSAFEGVGTVLSTVTDKVLYFARALVTGFAKISSFVLDTMTEIMELFGSDNLNGITKTLDTVFLGGLTGILAVFLKKGLKLDFGQSDLFESITGSFEQLTSTLKTMQTSVRADAIMKIALAMGVLTLALLVISTMDTASLVKGLIGIGVGIGAMVAGMILLEKHIEEDNAWKMIKLSVAMGFMAAAALLLSFAINSFGRLNIVELATGMAGVALSIALLAKMSDSIEGEAKGMIKAAFALTPLAIGLLLLAKAVGAFASIPIGDLVKGILAMNYTLTILVRAIDALPKDEKITSMGFGFILFAFSLDKLAKVIVAFAAIPTGDIIKGLLTLAVTLSLITGIVNRLPQEEMVGIGAGLLMISGALYIIAMAVEKMGSIGIWELIKGIGALTLILWAIVGAANAMQGALPGAAAILVVSGALYVLSKVIGEIGGLGLGTIIVGLVGLALTLAVLAAAAYLLIPVYPALMALGISLMVIGGGFALFGFGAMQVVQALRLLGDVGKESIAKFIEVIHMVLEALPAFVSTFAQAILQLVRELLEGAPAIVDAFGGVLEAILDKVIELAPKVGEAINALLTALLKLIRDRIDDLVDTGLIILESLLTGIRDNIDRLVDLGGDILIKFLEGLEKKIPDILTAATDLITTFIEGLVVAHEIIITAGTDMLVKLLEGIAAAIPQIATAVGAVVEAFVLALGTLATAFVTAGINALVSFLQGITDAIPRIAAAVGLFIIALITEIGKWAIFIADVGTQMLVKFLDAMGDNSVEVIRAIGNLITKIITAVGDEAKRIADAGTDALIDFLDGMQSNATRVTTKFAEVLKSIIGGVANAAIDIATYASSTLIKFLNSIADIAERDTGEVMAAFGRIGRGIITGMAKGITSNGDKLIQAIKDVLGGLFGAAAKALGFASPAKKYIPMGSSIAEGLAVGLDKGSHIAESAVVKVGDRTKRALAETLSTLPGILENMGDLNPTIAPVLDLTNVEAEARRLSSILAPQGVTADLSARNANLISTVTAETASEETPTSSFDQAPREVKFEQTINSPVALSTSDIYRQTRSQLAIAKEELAIP